MLNHNSDLTDVYSIFQKRDLLSPPHNEHPQIAGQGKYSWMFNRGSLDIAVLILPRTSEKFLMP